MTRHQVIHIAGGLALMGVLLSATTAAAQVVQRPGVPDILTNKMPTPPPGTPLPNFIIGPDDVLLVTVHNQKEVSGEVTVRPDGKITLPIGNDIFAMGLTTDELKDKVTTELKKFYEEPAVYIQVKAIKSRRVYISGNVAKPGVYELIGPMTVSQLITVAGGVAEYAKKKEIMLISATLKAKDGTPLAYKINYEDIERGRNLNKYNIELRPGDQVIVR